MTKFKAALHKLHIMYKCGITADETCSACLSSVEATPAVHGPGWKFLVGQQRTSSHYESRPIVEITQKIRP